STLVEYYIGRGGGTSAGSYSTTKGTFTLYTKSCNGPNITGTGPFTQYNADGSGSSGQPMGEHFNGWSSIGKGLSSQNYQVVMVESWSSGTGSAVVSVASSNWYTNWWGSGSASFTCGGGGTLPDQASNPGPANGATGVGITTDLSWNAGSGATSHDVYFGTAIPITYRGNRTTTTYDTGTMAGNTTYYWRIDEKNGTGTTTGNIWSFTTTIVAAPGKATSPSPSNGETGVGITTDLSWTAGSGATSHDVYFGTSYPPQSRGNQTGTSYDTGTMANNTTYYWRIDEKNDGGTTTGDLWSFTTASAEPETCADVHTGGYGLLSDLNNDCYVDELDLWIVTDYWLETDCGGFDDCEGSDFEPDGDVDFADFADFALLWLECNDPENLDYCTPNW
ncbi:MAG: glycoside hydrolase family 11 protein, partial [Sedimentisphaerales bacterium]|nr:glycoside hydrolase family 11 protein [Sedimentisphaerales bacterium]